jgi:hypothetical protein
VNTKICISKIYLLFHTTVKGRSLTIRDEQTFRLFEKRLLKKTFESKGRMKEKAEKNCIMRGFIIYTVPQMLLRFRTGHGA